MRLRVAEATLLGGMGRATFVAAALVAAFAAAPSASAAGWLPHPADATWTYEWSDSVYNATPTKEAVTVKEVKGNAFVLGWTTKDQGNPPEAPQAEGLMAFQETSSGLVNTDWQSTPPPSVFPILCAQVSRCGNSLAGPLYMLIWGTRAPLLSEPLMRGTAWASRGGADGDVTGLSQYQGTEQITVPAFPMPVTAAKVRTDVTQAGALGDPYGSGVRTTWWVYGVGPVKVVFEHAGGVNAPISQAVLHLDEPGARGAADRPELLPARAGPQAPLPLRQLEAHEEAVGAGVPGRRGGEPVGPGRREARLGADPRRRELRLRRPHRRAHEHLGRDAGRVARRRSRRSGRASCRRTGAATSSPRST